MKSLLLFALIFAVGPAFAAGTLKECQAKAEDKPKDCAKDAAAVKAESDAAAKAANASCEATRQGNDVSVPTCSTDFARANEASKSFYNEGLARCEDMAKECDDKCTPNASVKPPEKTKMASLKKQCRQKIEQTKSDLKKGGSGNKTGSEGGDKTSEQAKGNGSAPMIPPISPQQSNNDDEKTDATQPQSTPQQTTAATPQEEKKEETKNGSSGFDDNKQTQSADAACSGGKFMCPGCPGFAQKCGSGDASACISKMSSSDQNIINSNCGGSAGSSTTQALTNPTTPQSMTGMSLGGGSSGGTTGTVSGGMDTQSMLDDGKKNDTQSHEGRKEGGSLGTEGAGGGSGSSDSFGGSGGDLFGDNGNAMNGLNLNKAVPRSLASAFQGGGATDSKVVDRYGPNLFSILGETIKGRCDRNLLLHCPNRK
jgi:hypothetical protein